MMRNIHLSGGSPRQGRTAKKRGYAFLPLILALVILSAARWASPAEAGPTPAPNFNLATNETGFEIYQGSPDPTNPVNNPDPHPSVPVANPDPLGGEYSLNFVTAVPSFTLSSSFTNDQGKTTNVGTYDIANVFGIYQVYDTTAVTLEDIPGTSPAVNEYNSAGWSDKTFNGTAETDGFKTASAFGSDASLAVSAGNTPVGNFFWGASSFGTGATDNNIYWGAHLTYYAENTDPTKSSNLYTAFFYFTPGTSIPPHLQEAPEPAFYQMGGLLGLACIGGLRRRIKGFKIARTAA